MTQDKTPDAPSQQPPSEDHGALVGGGGEVREGTFLTSQGDRIVGVNPADFDPPAASAEPPKERDGK